MPLTVPCFPGQEGLSGGVWLRLGCGISNSLFVLSFLLTWSPGDPFPQMESFQRGLASLQHCQESVDAIRILVEAED